MRQLRIRLGRRKVTVEAPDIVGQPLLVSYGLGVDSTAMLVEMHNRGIRPDIIMHSHTGSEKPETYAYLPVINAWLKSVGFPLVSEVYTGSKKYTSLADACDNTETMPSKAYGKGSCSSRWKIEIMQREVNNNEQCQIAIASGLPVVRAIGFNNDARDCDRFNKAPKFKEGDTQYEVYPLQDWAMTRQDCVDVIEAAGLPVPIKSACYMCPSSQSWELAALNDMQLSRSLRIEARAIARTLRDKAGIPSTVGLGRKWNWRELMMQVDPERLIRLDASHDTGAATAIDNAFEMATRALSDPAMAKQLLKTSNTLKTHIRKYQTPEEAVA